MFAASIMQGPNGMQPPVSAIKLENPGGYYCNSYTPPAPDHSSMLPTGAYSKYTSICFLIFYLIKNWSLTITEFFTSWS